MTNIQNKAVTGITIMEQLKNATKEANVEYFFKKILIDIFKEKIEIGDGDNFKGKRVMTDGKITFTISPGHYIVGNQEAKIHKSETENERKKALCQSLHYNYFKFIQENEEYDYFFLPTEKGVAYVLRKDIEWLINRLTPLFAKTDKCPSKNWADLEIRKVMKESYIDFHYQKITPEFNLNNYFSEIFNKVKNA